MSRMLKLIKISDKTKKLLDKFKILKRETYNNAICRALKRAEK